MQTVPIGLGEQFIGVIQLARPIAEPTSVRFTLTCKEGKAFRTTIAGREVGASQCYDATLWQTSKKIDPRHDHDKVDQLPVAFHIPSDAIGTQLEAEIDWTLAVEAQGGWFPYFAEFDIPVFAIDRQRTAKEQNPNDADIATRVCDLTFADYLTLCHGRIGAETADGIELKFGGVRSPKATAAQFAKIALWFVICTGLYLTEAPTVMKFGFFLLGTIVFVAMLVESITSVTIAVNTKQVSLCKRIFGLGRQLRIEAGDVRSIEPQLMRRGINSLMQECVVVKKQDGKTIVLADGLLQRSTSEAIAKRLSATLALDTPTK